MDKKSESESERETENKSCSHVISLYSDLEINSNFDDDHGEYSI